MANGSSAQALLHIDWILVVSAAWLLVGAAGVAALRRLAFVARVLFPLGGALGLVLFGLAVSALGDTPEVAVLPIGLPSLPFHLRLDSLAAYFLMVIGAASAGISVFAAGYFRKGEGTPPGLLCMEYHVFLASMVGVVLADDAYAFMVMWETMALSSFFLVTANHRIPEVRSAGYLYITMAHIGAIAILLCFGVLQANTGDYTFDNMRAQRLEPFWASVGFLLAVLGFGVGGFLRGADVYQIWALGFDPLTLVRLEEGDPDLGRLPVALGHVGLIGLLCRWGRAGWLTAPLAATGRLALTHYISQTVFSIFVFYGLGLGLFGTLERWQLALICLGVWAFQIGFSVLWLQRYRHGPLEWLWRSLIYGRAQPMRGAG